MINGVVWRNDCDMYLNAPLGGTGFAFDSARHWFVCVRYSGLQKDRSQGHDGQCIARLDSLHPEGFDISGW